MSRKFSRLVLPLLAVLALLAPEKSVAGPSDGVSGRTVLDQVEDGLRRYRAARTPTARVVWLRKLAPIRDARVAVALGEAISSENLEVSRCAIGLVFTHYEGDLPEGTGPSPISGMVVQWWKTNEADLRRRAKLLPLAAVPPQLLHVHVARRPGSLDALLVNDGSDRASFWATSRFEA